MSKYYVDGIDISSLIGGYGNTDTSVSELAGFPTGWGDNRSIARAYNFGYSVNGSDVGPKYRGVQVDCNQGQTNVDISVAPYRKFKHIASLIYAAGGGGGGGGGQGWNGGSRNTGGKGAAGGKGGYVWIRDRGITGQRWLTCNIGGGGNGGNVGSASNNPSGQTRTGGQGNGGNPGGESRLRAYDNGSVNFYDIMGANGGGGGTGGNGGRGNLTINVGNNGDGFGGGGQGVGEDADSANLYKYTDRDGSGGDGGAGSGVGGSTTGGAGQAGLGWIWFLYAKN